MNIAPATVCEPQETWFPCTPYITIDDLCGPCKRIDPDNPDDVALFNNLAVNASRILYLATGQRYPHCCELTFHPCSEPCPTPTYAYGVPTGTGPWLGSAVSAPVPVKNGWVNVWPCTCGPNPDGCWCHTYTELPLPWGPAQAVTAIMIGGTVVDPSTYFLSPDRTTILRDGGELWPECNSLTDPMLEWTVSYTVGAGIPPEAKPLLALYVCELVALCKREPCDLPTSMFKDFGASGVAPISTGYRADMLTGYKPLDDWIVLQRAGRTIHQPRLHHPTLAPRGVGQ